ncbi:hypothetical protein [Caldisericum sp.]|uniref:hypothetical protein n=1 Tax=Caldisericum sp. TaxID=2499687 RepID=UPI003D0E1720
MKEVDWRKEIELFIEKKAREVEVSKTLDTIDKALSEVEISREPAWQTIRESRDGS